MSSIGCYWTFPVGAEQPGGLEAEGGGGDGRGAAHGTTTEDEGDEIPAPVGQVGKSDPRELFWQKLPKNRGMDGPSLTSHIKQLSLALALGGLDMEKVKLVCTNLERGADIGCKGPARGESYSSNAASCELGQITHAIGGWLEKGFAVGPF